MGYSITGRGGQEDERTESESSAQSVDTTPSVRADDSGSEDTGAFADIRILDADGSWTAKGAATQASSTLGSASSDSPSSKRTPFNAQPDCGASVKVPSVFSAYPESSAQCSTSTSAYTDGGGVCTSSVYPYNTLMAEHDAFGPTAKTTGTATAPHHKPASAKHSCYSILASAPSTAISSSNERSICPDYAYFPNSLDTPATSALPHQPSANYSTTSLTFATAYSNGRANSESCSQATTAVCCASPVDPSSYFNTTWTRAL